MCKVGLGRGRMGGLGSVVAWLGPVYYANECFVFILTSVSLQ